jgi:hypothetical protein
VCAFAKAQAPTGGGWRLWLVGAKPQGAKAKAKAAIPRLRWVAARGVLPETFLLGASVRKTSTTLTTPLTP